MKSSEIPETLPSASGAAALPSAVGAASLPTGGAGVSPEVGVTEESLTEVLGTALAIVGLLVDLTDLCVP
jgi:hypothetical protein